MNELQAVMQIVLANTFTMYFKAHTYHWNVEGMFFSQYHDFFGDLYEELYGAIDPTAEEIRALDAYAPISIVDMMKSSTLSEDEVKPANIRLMLSNLLAANSAVVESLNKAFGVAQTMGNQGLMDFLAGRLDVHNKHAWMLRSSLKNIGE